MKNTDYIVTILGPRLGKLTVSKVTDNTVLLCCARYVHVNDGDTDIFGLVWLLSRHFMIFF